MAALPILQTVAVSYRFYPLDEASFRTGHSEAELRADAEAGKILAGMLNGELQIAVTEDGHVVRIAQPAPEPEGDDINARLRQIRREDFAHLEGVPITVSEAAKKYGVSPQTLHNWIKKGYIVPIQKGVSKSLPTICNEAEVAYCTEIYRVRKSFGTLFGVPLLKEDGTPYLLKHPALSRYRRQQQN